jgi:hypothetical protein
MDHGDQPSTMAYRSGGRQALDVSAFAAGVSSLQLQLAAIPKSQPMCSNVQQLGSSGQGAATVVDSAAVEQVVVSVTQRFTCFSLGGSIWWLNTDGIRTRWGSHSWLSCHSLALECSYPSVLPLQKPASHPESSSVKLSWFDGVMVPVLLNIWCVACFPHDASSPHGAYFTGVLLCFFV